MHSDDVIIVSSANDELSAAVTESLMAAGIDSNLLSPGRVTEADLGHPMFNYVRSYIAVRKVDHLAAHYVVSRVSRICVKCEAFILAEDDNCRRCGTRHPEPPQSI